MTVIIFKVKKNAKIYEVQLQEIAAESATTLRG